MKSENGYLVCETCRASAPTPRAAKAAGWVLNENVWICDSCYEGTIHHGMDDDDDDGWVPDDDEWR